MQKLSKTGKSSIRQSKHKKNPTKKQSFIVSARTPKSTNLRIDFPSHPTQMLKSIKSIPNITYREVETTNFPSELFDSFSHLNNKHRQADSDIVNYLSQRTRPQTSNSNKPSVTKGQSQHRSKINIGVDRKTIDRISTKRKNTPKATSSVKMLPISSSSNICPGNQNFTALLDKTKNILQSYQKRQQSWKKQKRQLLKEVQKLKRKANGKSTATTCSSHNSHQSHKYLI